MQIFNYIWGYDLEIYVSLLSPDFPEETCQRLNISSAPQPSINRKKWKGTSKWKKGWPFLNSPCQLLAISIEHGERVVNGCQRNVCRTKTNRGWEFRLEAYLSNLYLFYSDLAIREAIKNMLSISDKWSKLQTDPAATTILLFENWAILSLRLLKTSSTFIFGRHPIKWTNMVSCPRPNGQILGSRCWSCRPGFITHIPYIDIRDRSVNYGIHQ